MKRLFFLAAAVYTFKLSSYAARAQGDEGSHQNQHIFDKPEYPNNGIHLAVHPVCGTLSGKVADVNTGIDMENIKTIVAFGVRTRTNIYMLLPHFSVIKDSYTDGGRDDGGPLAPPVVVPPDALAGGRSTNGKTWVEHLAEDSGAKLMDYAVIL